MTAMLQVLAGHELIRRDQDPTDGRRQLITLTNAGRRRAEGDQAARAEWLARALHHNYTEAERQILLDALTLLDRLTHL
ncbi:Regulatory protein MarR (fragment) [Frankia canadensis]|uniref:Regulatory protein MarR n=2 Tax=Frankia canadensis TaxID=1836972 RepID=A0A2I2KI20_9ACTN